MIQYEFRNYLPAIGRWMTRDPLGEAGGLNLYAFVGNNPVNWVDPWGLTINNKKGQLPVPYKDEHTTELHVVLSGKKSEWKHDGLVEPATGDVYKTPGKYCIQDDVWIDERGYVHDVTDWKDGGKKDFWFFMRNQDWTFLFLEGYKIKVKNIIEQFF